MSNETPNFECPPDMEPFTKFIFKGEYEVPGFDLPAPTILDIGANCGAFSVWASHRWPDYSMIYAYEPAQIAWSYLTKNIASAKLERVVTMKVAVTSSGRTKLYCGRDNLGQSTLYPELGQTIDTYELPAILHPKELPAAQIIKVDAEGAEFDILTHYLAAHTPYLVMFEYHGEEERRKLDGLLAEKGYTLGGGHISCPERGVLKYLRRINE